METLREAYANGRIHHDLHEIPRGVMPRGTVWVWSDRLKVWLALSPKRARDVDSITEADVLHDPHVYVVKKHEVKALLDKYAEREARVLADPAPAPAAREERGA